MRPFHALRVTGFLLASTVCAGAGASQAAAAAPLSKAKPSNASAALSKAKTPTAVLKKAPRFKKAPKAIRGLFEAKREGIFADFPPAPTPIEVQSTPDSFALSARQGYTNAGYLMLRNGKPHPQGNVIVLSQVGRLDISITPGWAEGRDLSVECWGLLENRSIQVSAYSQKQGFLGSATVKPSAGEVGKARVTIPSADFDLSSPLALRVGLAEQEGPIWYVHMCRVSRS